MQGFKLDDTELNEYTHLMLSNVAASLGQEFGPYLPTAIERAFESLNQKDTNAADGSEKENEGSVSLNSQEDSEDEEEGDNELDRRLNLHTGNTPYLM